MLSGVQFVGNVLDTPGAILRNILALRNPLQGLFDFEQRTTGRQLAEKWGWVEPNKPGLDSGDAVGVGVEVAFDPLTWVTFGASAPLTQAGKAAKASGALKLFDNTITGHLGKRAARRKTTLRDAIRQLPDTQARREVAKGVRDYAARHGLSARDLWDDVLSHGGVGVRAVPIFGDAKWHFKSKAADRFSDLLDSTGRAIRYSAPVNALARHVSARRAGAGTGHGAMVAHAVDDSYIPAIANATRLSQNWMQAVQKWRPELVDGTLDSNVLLRELMETPAEHIATRFPGITQEAIDATIAMQDEADRLFDLTRRLGRAGEAITEIEGGRRWSARHSPIGGRPLDMHRLEALRTAPTGPLMRLFADEDVIRIATDPNLTNRGKVRDLKRILPHKLRRYGISQVYDPPGAKTQAREYAERLFAEYSANPQERLNLGINRELLNILSQGRPVNITLDELEAAILKKSPSLSTPAGRIDRTQPLAELLTEVGTGEGGEALMRRGYWNPVAADMESYLSSTSQRASMLESLTSALADRRFIGDALRSFPSDRRVNLGDYFGDWKRFNRDRALLAIGRKMGLTGKDRRVIDRVAQIQIPARTADDLKRVYQGLSDERVVGSLRKAFDNFTNIFKPYVLAWPSRLIRDYVTGTARNALLGMWDLTSSRQIHRLLAGKSVEGLEKVPIIAERLKAKGLTGADAAKQEFMQLLHEYRIAPRYAGEFEEIVPGMRAPREAHQMLSDPLIDQGILRPVLDPLIRPSQSGTSWRPMDLLFGMRGVSIGNKGALRTKTTNPLVASAEGGGFIVEANNRAVPFLNLLKKGVSPTEAARRVLDAQVDYSMRAYTPFEREVLLRLFPFGRFTKGMVKSLAKELSEKPGGPTAQLIRAARHSHGQMAGMPPHIAQGLAIPAGEDKEGNPQFMTTTGMMHEDPISFLAGARSGLDIAGLTRGAGLEMLSRAHPVPKGILEWAMGRSAFQAGAQGGRDLRDMDPLVGRIIANVTGDEGEPIRMGMLDHIISNTPVTRALSTARTLTDTRKDWLDKVINLTTGARVSSVTPTAREAVLREQIEQMMRDRFPQVRQFQRTYLPQDAFEQMTPEQQQAALAHQQLLAILSERAKKRAEEREKKERREGKR